MATKATRETAVDAGPGDHSDAVDGLVPVEGGFDFAEFDPVAALLDHPVAAAVEAMASLAVAADKVAGSGTRPRSSSRKKAREVRSGRPK